MGKLLDWNNMPPVGTPVVFKGYRTGRHKHWGFKVGNTYYVGRGIWPPRNYGDEFIFELATPFTINKGDYIDSREFSREECERFCELAVECGFKESCHVSEYWFIDGDGYITGTWNACCKELKNNITAKFREFLDKEKGMKKFTKADLKDGMRIELRKWAEDFYVCGDIIQLIHQGENGRMAYLNQFNEDLTTCSADKDCDIMKVTDRDGTVLFEREEEPREISLDEIAKAFNLPVERVRIKK